MLKNTVKASGITHLTDARYFAAWDVGYLGFPLGQGGISNAEFLAMREWITGPKLVGELSLPDIVPEGLAQLKLTTLQGSELFSVEALRELREINISTLMVELVVQGYHSVEDVDLFCRERSEVVDQFLLNFTKGGIMWSDIEAGDPLRIDALRVLTQQYPILLEIDGLPPTEIQQLLPALKGFSVRGSAEEKVGYKDFDVVDDFF
ncbi:MAG: hypothetical protein AAFQ37_00925, partial [Bacteroidota bacterium]